jgi:hypothetical protein
MRLVIKKGDRKGFFLQGNKIQFWQIDGSLYYQRLRHHSKNRKKWTVQLKGGRLIQSSVNLVGSFSVRVAIQRDRLLPFSFYNRQRCR